MLVRLEAFWRLTESDLLWLFEQDEYAAPAFYIGLGVWCRKQDRISRPIQDLVRTLRDEDDTSDTLDAIAASVAPSAEGMLDLAGWESAFRCCGDDEWRQAPKRWEAGQQSTDDIAVLAPSLDPEFSSNANANALMEAIRLNGRDVVARALRDGWETAEHAIPRAILNAWLEHFGGAR